MLEESPGYPGAVAAQPGIDAANAGFWDELCGTNLARELGITDASPASLERFDRAYFDLYPYLAGYLRAPEMAGSRVLEVGLGYGTVAERLARAGADYHGVDIAGGPVAMAQARLERLPGARPEGVQQGSALDLPLPDASFDRVISIGCLHHTGDLPQSVAEVHRVLAPGGRAVVMLYHAHSFRRVAFRLWDAATPARRRRAAERMRKLYDADPAGAPAPHTDFVSRRGARRLFGDFERVRIDVQNFDSYRFGIQREWFLSNLARVVGLDLYIVADKRPGERSS
jgi:SAM-dependent methyltransferase